jgi:hypothetical protein
LLRIHASNGTGIYKDIIDNQYGDYRAVTAVTNSRFSPKINDWNTVLRTWLAANAICSTGSDQYGYKNQIQVNFKSINSSDIDKIYDHSDHSVSLDPGEAIYSLLSVPTNTSIFVPYTEGPYIQHAGINRASKTIETNTATLNSGGITNYYLLTFNYDTKIDYFDSGYGYVTNIRESPESLAMRSDVLGSFREADYTPPEPWKVDGIAYIRDRNRRSNPDLQAGPVNKNKIRPGK